MELKQCRSCISYDEKYDMQIAAADDCIVGSVEEWAKEHHYCHKWFDARRKDKNSVDEIADSRMPDEIAEDKVECPYRIEGIPLSEIIKRMMRGENIDPVTGEPLDPKKD